MATLTVEQLVKELHGLDHGDRAKRIGQLGHSVDADELRTLCASLNDADQFGDFGAQTAVALARHGRLGEVVLSALNHPSLFVQRHAMRSLAFIPLTDEQLAGVYLSAAQVHRPIGIALMRLGRKHDLARQLVETDTQTDRAKSKLLTACSESYAREVLSSVAHAVASWSALARAHPDVVIEFARAEVAAAPLSQQMANLLRFSSAFSTLAMHRPRELLSLFASVADDPGYHLGAVLPHLIRVAPAEAAAYIAGLADPRHVINNRRISRCLRLLDSPAASELSNAAESTSSPGPVMRSLARRVGDNHATLAELLRAASPSHRGALLQEAFVERSVDLVVLSDALMEVLPTGVRAEQARRMLALREVSTDPEATFRIASYLPFDEAWPLLEAMTKRSDADQRANGYQRLIICATLSRDPAALTQAMEHLTRLKNDQDPVRMQATSMLRQVPATRFGDEHAPFLSALAQCVVEARDTSWSTRSNLQSALVEVLVAAAPNPNGALFQSALTSLVRMAGRDGSLPLPLLEKRLQQRYVAAFINALLPLAKTRALADHETLTISVARSLGRKCWNHAELQDLLETIVLKGTVSGATLAVDLYLANPRFRVARAKALVAKDQSYLSLPAVHRVASYQAQHLLAPLLTGVALKGRFASKQKVATIPLFNGAFQRWSPAQVEAYAALLVRLINAKSATAWEQVGAIRTLTRLPQIASVLIASEVASPSENVPRLEAAIAALANTDRPQVSIETLMSFAGSDRARVAIYALGRAVRRSPAANTVPALIGLANNTSAKITSRKEAIRLLGELRTPSADAALEALVGTTELHKDLRIALGWSALANGSAPWFTSAMQALATGSVDEQQALVDLHPLRVPVQRRTAIAQEIISLTRSTDASIQKHAYQSLASWSQWFPEVSAIGVTAFANLDEPNWKPATSFLQQLIADCLIADDAIAQAFTSLIERIHQQRPLRDLPALQRLTTFSAMLTAPAWPQRERYRSTLVTLADLSRSNKLLVFLAADLEAASIDWSQPFDLVPLVDRLPASMLVTHHLSEKLSAVMGEQLVTNTWNQATTLASLQTAFSANDPRIRYLAAALTISAGTQLGWPQPWQDLLTTARADNDPDTNRLAYSAFTKSE
jgi:hypothetical protein